jgi:hypothetical protein
MSNLNDPYRNAVRHTIEDREKERRKKIFVRNRQKEKSKSFFQKKIYLNNLFDLPEGLAKMLFLGMFIFIPYLVGVLFTFLILAKANFRTYERVENSFAFSWVIGYEFLATLLLLMIFISAIRFSTCSPNPNAKVTNT